jgi:hypothetical protein
VYASLALNNEDNMHLEQIPHQFRTPTHRVDFTKHGRKWFVEPFAKGRTHVYSDFAAALVEAGGDEIRTNGRLVGYAWPASAGGVCVCAPKSKTHVPAPAKAAPAPTLLRETDAMHDAVQRLCDAASAAGRSVDLICVETGTKRYDTISAIGAMRQGYRVEDAADRRWKMPTKHAWIACADLSLVHAEAVLECEGERGFDDITTALKSNWVRRVLLARISELTPTPVTRKPECFGDLAVGDVVSTATGRDPYTVVRNDKHGVVLLRNGGTSTMFFTGHTLLAYYSVLPGGQ